AGREIGGSASNAMSAKPARAPARNSLIKLLPRALWPNRRLPRATLVEKQERVKRVAMTSLFAGLKRCSTHAVGSICVVLVCAGSVCVGAYAQTATGIPNFAP